MNNKDIIKSLKKELDSKRFEHTLGVAYTSACLAMKYNYDHKKAFLAGLLHDCAKGLTDKERLEYCSKHCIEVKDVERENPSLLHAKVGASIAKLIYDIDDEDILSAITYHTTGRCNMSLLEEIVFVADYIEPLREHDSELATIRMEAFTNLDRAVFHIYSNTVKYLEKTTKSIDPTTKDAYIYYSEHI